MDAGELLRRAGWVPGRRVDVEEMLGALAAAGFVVVPAAREFLAEYSGLVITSEDGRSVTRIDGHEAARNAVPGWCAAYGHGIGRAVTPIGEYSHMTLVIDEAGEFWGGFDDQYGSMGDTIIDVVHELLVEPGARPFDRVVAD
ncbi:SUKH-3 domain-containing protein [Frankia sp. CNm7]|uniref:SUKH-3 domain-containing protein n=1 Tax=Frankia nepalensis TaxID=1836974 RepID=UPI001931476A|nr:SUKH-3 domain-containing protein [Frankia nepalensis]MBL7520203.1 SUKH-3 domain-containing protein [Frankia nepalensis]